MNPRAWELAEASELNWYIFEFKPRVCPPTLKSLKNPPEKPACENGTLWVAGIVRLPEKESPGANAMIYAVPAKDCPVFVRPNVPLRLLVTKVVAPSVQTVVPVQPIRKLAVVVANAGAVVISRSPTVIMPHVKTDCPNGLTLMVTPFMRII